MAVRNKCSIELYDGRNGAKRRFWRLGAVLYHANCGDPVKFRTELEAMIEQAQSELKASGVRYWYNSVRFAGMMVARSVEGEHNMPRLHPATQLLPTSNFLFRVYLAPNEQVTVTCFRVLHTDDGILEGLTHFDEVESES